jgi:hypothetical protein
MEVAMINDVVLEGMVVRTWKYADDLLFRLACYRNPDVPQKPLNEVQYAADFVTIQVPKGNLGASVVEKNFHVRVHCFLHSHDYEPLFSFPDGLHVSIRHGFWMSKQGIEVNTCDIGEDMGHTVTEVKIAFPMSHNILTSTEEDIQ